MQIQTTAIIRDRGQLTIPDKIRKNLKWPSNNTVVSITADINKKIVIEPYEENKKKVDWNQIWKNIRKIRSYKTKNSRPASELIAEDRYNH